MPLPLLQLEIEAKDGHPGAQRHRQQGEQEHHQYHSDHPAQNYAKYVDLINSFRDSAKYIFTSSKISKDLMIRQELLFDK